MDSCCRGEKQQTLRIRCQLRPERKRKEKPTKKKVYTVYTSIYGTILMRTLRNMMIHHEFWDRWDAYPLIAVENMKNHP